MLPDCHADIANFFLSYKLLLLLAVIQRPITSHGFEPGGTKPAILKHWYRPWRVAGTKPIATYRHTQRRQLAH